MALIKDILRTMDYGPAPEGSEHVAAWLDEHDGGFGHFINGALHQARRRCSTSSIRRPASGSRARPRARRPTSTRRSQRRARRKPKWAALSGHERARYLYALARHVQKRERFLSVLETIDNGKPIRESRDIDIPLVARHFYHHAGWAALIESEFPGTEPVGVCGQIIPWNFPLLMLAWKIAPALAAGQYGRAEAGRIYAADRARLRRDLRRGGLPAGVVNIVTGDGATGAALVAPSGRRQDRLHRLDRGRPRDPQGDRRHGQEAVARTRRQVAVRRVRGRRSRQRGRRRRSTRSGSTRARSAAPARGCWSPRASPKRCTPSCAPAWRSLRVGDPLDKSTDIGAIVAPAQLERIERLVERGRDGGARRSGRPTARCRIAAASIRRPWSPESSPLRSWRARRSSVRCWSR